MRRVICILLVLVMGCPAQAVQWLKQSTAKTVKMGPFVDSTDGFTAETAITISQADIRVSKNGGDFAQTNNAAGATHDENGWFDVPLDTTDTGTLGTLDVAIYESGALPVLCRYMVVPANVWDSMFGADYLQVDRIQVGGTANASVTIANAYGGSTFQSVDDVYDEDLSGHSTAGTAGKALTDIGTKTGYLPSATAGAAGGVFIAGSNAATSVATAFTANITGSLSGSVGSVTGAVASVTGNVGGNVTGTIGGLTAAALKDFFDTDSTTGYASAVAGSVVKEIADNAGGSALTESGIAAAVWGEALSTYTTPGDAGYYLGNSATSAEIVDDLWDELLSGHATAGSAAATLAAAGSAGDPWSTVLPGAYGANTAGKALSDVLTDTAAMDTSTEWRTLMTGSDTPVATASAVDAVDNYVDTEVAAIATLLGTPAGASVSADIAAVKSDAAAAKTAAEKIDTSTELRTLLAGSDTALAIASNQTSIINTLGAAGAGLTGLPLVSLAAGSINTIRSGLAASSEITTVLNTIGTPAGASVSADIAAVPTLAEATALVPTGFSANTMTDGKLDTSASVSLTEGDQTAIAAAIVVALNASGVTLTADAVDAILDELVTGHDTPSSLGWYIKKIKASLWK